MTKLFVLTVPLSDPACFAPVIKYVKSIAEKMNQEPGNNYVVLLIITDGGITGDDTQLQFQNSDLGN